MYYKLYVSVLRKSILNCKYLIYFGCLVYQFFVNRCVLLVEAHTRICKHHASSHINGVATHKPDEVNS